MNCPTGLTLILLALHAPAGNTEAMDHLGFEPRTDRLWDDFSNHWGNGPKHETNCSMLLQFIIHQLQQRILIHAAKCIRNGMPGSEPKSLLSRTVLPLNYIPTNMIRASPLIHHRCNHIQPMWRQVWAFGSDPASSEWKDSNPRPLRLKV